MFAPSTGKVDKYEYMTGEEILSPQQHRIIQEVKFTYSQDGKIFEKQTKTIEEQRKNKLKLYGLCILSAREN